MHARPDSLLARLGLRQPNRWDPPTALDRVITSPTRAAAYYLYRWNVAVRGWAASRQRRAALDKARATGAGPPAVRVVCLSDTHDKIVADVPDGDLLIHAGDLTNRGMPGDLQKQLDWLASLPHPHKVVVSGNHDSWFDPVARAARAIPEAAGAPQFADNMHYLEHGACTITFASGRQLKVYGAPDIPECGPPWFSFQYPPSAPPWKDTVPADVDVLVTHVPPRHHLDLLLGCPGLLEELWRVRPPLHVFGHVHWGAGRQTVFWDEAQRAYEAIVEADAKSTPATLAVTLGRLGRLLAAAAGVTLLLPVSLVAPGVLASESRGASSILVNAGQTHGNTGRLGNSVQVVDL